MSENNQGCGYNRMTSREIVRLQQVLVDNRQDLEGRKSKEIALKAGELMGRRVTITNLHTAVRNDEFKEAYGYYKFSKNPNKKNAKREESQAKSSDYQPTMGDLVKTTTDLRNEIDRLWVVVAEQKRLWGVVAEQNSIIRQNTEDIGELSGGLKGVKTGVMRLRRVIDAIITPDHAIINYLKNTFVENTPKNQDIPLTKEGK